MYKEINKIKEEFICKRCKIHSVKEETKLCVKCLDTIYVVGIAFGVVVV